MVAVDQPGSAGGRPRFVPDIWLLTAAVVAASLAPASRIEIRMIDVGNRLADFIAQTDVAQPLLFSRNRYGMDEQSYSTQTKPQRVHPARASS